MRRPKGETIVNTLKIQQIDAGVRVKHLANAFTAAAFLFVLAGAHSAAHAQNVPVGRILVVDGVSAVLVPVNPPPTFQGLPNVPEQFRISGIMLSVSSGDTLVASFHTSMRVETASGARLDITGNIKRDSNLAWASEIFYTGKDPVVKVLSLTVIPLLPNQMKVFTDQFTDQ
jgi:hypothetical protein